MVLAAASTAGSTRAAAEGSAGQTDADVSTLPRTREIESLIESLVASWNGVTPILQRRRWHRVLFQNPLALTPMDNSGRTLDGESKLVQGRDISLGGISFTHADPLPCRLVAVTFIQSEDKLDSVVTKLTWCRFMRDGLYRSGGQFLRTVRLPILINACWEALPSA